MFDLPEDQDEAAWGVIRRFWWVPSIVEDHEQVILMAGDQVVATFDTIVELRAFVSGMATAHMSNPPEVIAELGKVLGAEPDWADRPSWWAERDLP